jgi:hypothetical protein
MRFEASPICFVSSADVVCVGEYLNEDLTGNCFNIASLVNH